MNKLSKKGWLLFLGISLLVPVFALAAFHWFNKRLAELPYYGENFELQTKQPFYTVPGYSFINQDSNVLNNDYTKGRIWVAHYFFTSCPSVCPKMIKGMGDVQEAFSGNENVKLVSLTVDPDHDTPAVLKAYAANHNIATSQWQLLTGNKKELYRYARNGLFIVATDGDGGPGDFIHSDKLVLIDRENHIRGYYDGTDKTAVHLLINDIKRLLPR